MEDLQWNTVVRAYVCSQTNEEPWEEQKPPTRRYGCVSRTPDLNDQQKTRHVSGGTRDRRVLDRRIIRRDRVRRKATISRSTGYRRDRDRSMNRRRDRIRRNEDIKRGTRNRKVMDRRRDKMRQMDRRKG